MSIRHLHFRFSSRIAFLGLLGLALPALAAEPPLPPLQGKTDEGRAAEAPASSFVLPAVVPEAGSTAAAPKANRMVRAISFSGNTVFPESALRNIAEPYLNRSLGALEIEELRRKLTLLYVNAGYVNSGAVIKPTPDEATLHFNIVEGTVSKVRLRGLERLDENYVAYRLVPEPGEPLNIDYLRERYQLLLADPLFDGINTRLIPDLIQGKAILDVEVTRARPYQLSVFANNYRAPSIGEESVGVNGLVRNLSGYGDALRLNWQAAASGGSDRYGLNWSVPINRYGTTMTLQLDEGSSAVVEEPLGALDIRSKLSSQELGLVHPLIDSLSQRLALGLAFSERENRTELLGQPFSFAPGVPDGVLKARTWKLWQDYSYRTETSVFAARVSYNAVRDNLLPPSPGSAAQTPPQRYHFWVTQLNFGHRLTDAGTQFQMRATMQNAKTRLTSLDGMAIGGVNTVRGYRENQLLRDKGSIVNVEVDVPLLSSKDATALQFNVIPFVDWGAGNNIGEPASGLASAGLAFRAAWRGLALELALAERLHHPKSIDALSGTNQDKAIHFQLSYNPF